MVEEIYYDPYDYALDAHPHPMWKRMRDEAPLYYNEKFDFFAVTRFNDVRDMSADWRTYSSHYGSVLELIDHPEVLEQARNMLFEDPPIHDDHRSILARTFTPRRISNLEPQIRALCTSYLEELPATFDFVRDYGARIPMMVIGMLLGVPEEDREHLRHLADQTVHRDEGETDYNADGQAQMMEYFAGHVALRRDNPVDDIMSDLVHADVEAPDGTTRKLDDLELVQYMSLVVGGRQRDRRQPHGVGGHVAVAPSRPAPDPDRRSRRHPERRRGTPALRGALTHPGADGHARRRGPRTNRPEGIQDGDADRVGRSGRARLPRS